MPLADIGNPTTTSLLESVGTYALSASHPQLGTTNAQAQADSVPLEIDGICCTNFTADSTNYIGSGAGVIYAGLLSAYPTTYGAGIVDPTSGSPETWTTSEAHSYEFVISLNNNAAAQGLSSTATFTWEARNL